MELTDLTDLLAVQSGIVARRQVLELGGSAGDIKRWVRRRDLVAVHLGVYAGHTGELGWDARAWAAVQRYWPAALALQSAIDDGGEAIHVAIDAGRSTPVPTPGIVVHRWQGVDERVQWTRSPPRQRLEDAVLARCARLDRVRAVALISEVCRERRTTPGRLLARLAELPALKDRGFLCGVLADVERGASSMLERSFIRNVEEAHALPRSERQVSVWTAQGRIWRDLRWRAFGVVGELDGRIGHERSVDRWADQDRDLDAALEQLITIRLGWRHSEHEPCRTAVRLGRLFNTRGWDGRPRRCRLGCEAGD